MKIILFYYKILTDIVNRKDFYDKFKRNRKFANVSIMS